MSRTVLRFLVLTLTLQAGACALEAAGPDDQVERGLGDPGELDATAGQLDRGPRMYRDIEGRLVAEADLAGSLAAPSAAAAAYPILDGPYLLINYHSGRCLEVPGNATANGVWIDQWTCVANSNDALNEVWVLVWINSYSFRLLNGETGKCMNVEGDSAANSARIIQWTCGNYVNESFTQYRYSDMPAGYFYFGTNSGKVLNIAGATSANGADLIQWTEVRRSNEYFKGR